MALTAVLCGIWALFGQYDFTGKHFVASYLECDQIALGDVDELMLAMDGAVQASGATILGKNSYVFPPNGVTIVYLLSESHASIHTYPEFGACFVDLFTCGESCSANAFDTFLKNYLKPRQVSGKLLLRDEGVRVVEGFGSDASGLASGPPYQSEAPLPRDASLVRTP